MDLIWRYRLLVPDTYPKQNAATYCPRVNRTRTRTYSKLLNLPVVPGNLPLKYFPHAFSTSAGTS